MLAALRSAPNLLTLAAFALAWPASIAAADTGQPLPRYRFEVGQELKYSGQDEFKYESGKFITDSTWRVWVVRKNDDGGWRLILRSGSLFRQVDEGARGGGDEDVSFAWYDFSPTGSLVENDSFGFRMSPGKLLVRLPADEMELKAGWTGRDRRLDETFRCRLHADQPSGERATIEVVRDSPMNEIYGFEFKDLVTFDLRRGLPEKIASESKQTYGFNGQGQGTLELDEVSTHDAAWCRDFATDADRYFVAHKRYTDALAAKTQPANEFEKSIEQAIAELRQAKEQITSPEFKQQIDHVLTQHEKFASHYAESARKREAILNRPAAEWTCADLDGKEHALKDQRGRVVVLDFWYRGCGWCVRAMPQMKEIAAHFDGKPVTIFGMNTDREEEDARFVVGKMGLNYANLKATGVPERYSVQGFPTLLIIDQEGIVRDIHTGYSSTLKEKVVKSIEGLLEKKS